MRLHDLSRRDRFYNEGLAYDPIPAVRIPVVPGQSNEIGCTLKFQTAAFSKNVVTGGMASLFLFYVPNRLVWDDWVGFIAQDDDFAGTFPRSSTNWAKVFDQNANGYTGGASTLYRRAYKLCYNQFFGDADMDAVGATHMYYSDITDDTDIVDVQVKTTEQWAGRLVTDGAIATPTYDATTVPIDLNDFYRSMMNARSQRKANMSGDKYVDALRRMGVEPDWRIQQAPEFLGRVDKDVLPVKTFNTSATGQGDSVARFEGTLEYRTRRKMFAEHGYIVGIFIMRPHVFNQNLDVPPDGAKWDIEDFYLADNMRDQDTYAEQNFTTGTGETVYAQRFDYLRNGSHVRGDGVQWAVTLNTGAIENVIYPSGTLLPVSDELGTQNLAFCCSTHLVGASPVPPNAL